MERVFCENCGRQRRAVEAIGAYEGTPYCETCRKMDDIPEQDFVRFGVQSVASDAGSRSQVATPEARKAGYEVFNPQTATAPAKLHCIDCGARIKLHGKREPRLQCRDCEKKAKPVIRVSPKRLSDEVRAFAKLPAAAKDLNLPQIIQKAPNKKLLRELLSKPARLALLSDDDYEKLKPHAEHNDLTRQLLAQIGMIVAVRGPKQGRLKLDAKKGDSRNLACRIRRLLRNEKIAAEVEAFMKASCVVVSVGYGKQGK